MEVKLRKKNLVILAALVSSSSYVMSEEVQVNVGGDSLETLTINGYSLGGEWKEDQKKFRPQKLDQAYYICESYFSQRLSIYSLNNLEREMVTSAKESIRKKAIDNAPLKYTISTYSPTQRTAVFITDKDNKIIALGYSASYNHPYESVLNAVKKNLNVDIGKLESRDKYMSTDKMLTKGYLDYAAKNNSNTQRIRNYKGEFYHENIGGLSKQFGGWMKSALTNDSVQGLDHYAYVFINGNTSNANTVIDVVGDTNSVENSFKQLANLCVSELDNIEAVIKKRLDNGVVL